MLCSISLQQIKTITLERTINIYLQEIEIFTKGEARKFEATQKDSKSLLWAENLNLLPITVNNLFKFSAQDSDLEYIFELHQPFWKKATFRGQANGTGCIYWLYFNRVYQMKKFKEH